MNDSRLPKQLLVCAPVDGKGGHKYCWNDLVSRDLKSCKLSENWREFAHIVLTRHTAWTWDHPMTQPSRLLQIRDYGLMLWLCAVAHQLSTMKVSHSHTSALRLAIFQCHMNCHIKVEITECGGQYTALTNTTCEGKLIWSLPIAPDSCHWMFM